MDALTTPVVDIRTLLCKGATESVVKQIICRSGHVTEIDYETAPGLIAHVRECPKCGGAAVWYRNRPPVVVTRSGYNMDPRQR